MSDELASGSETPAQRARPMVVQVLGRFPVTLGFIGVLLVFGVVSQALWSPFVDHPWFEVVGYGLPAFEAGRWWTPVTGTFFVIQPWVYVTAILGFWGMAYVEHRRGWRVALAYYWAGQLFAVLGAALLLVVGRNAPWWGWAHELATTVDVGPSGGTMACAAAAVGLFAAPWRQRIWIVMFGFAGISLLFLGTLADLEHALAIVLVLGVDRSFRIGRTTVSEQRMLASATLIALGVVQLLVAALPTYGPFGRDAAQPTSFADVILDFVVIVLAVVGLRRGRRWGWLIALLLVVLNVLIGAVALLLRIVASEQVADILGSVDTTIATAVLWLAFGIFLLRARRAFQLWRRRPIAGTSQPSVEEVRELIRTEGAGTLSWMTTWEGMEYHRTSTGIVPFQTQGRAAIVLADPLGDPDGIPTSVAEFVEVADRGDLVPCFFSASEITRSAMPDGWRSLVVADDTLVDLAGLTFQGKAWAKVRQSFSRGEREGMTFRLTRLADEPFAIRAQLQAISEQWVGEKDLPEMRFTLGTLAEAADPEVRMALAIDPQGNVDGMLSWLPIYGPGGQVRGWTLDLMRRRDGGFPAVMEFLIGQSARAFGDEGADVLSLSGAPLAHENDESDKDTGLIGGLLGRLGETLEPVYGFRSLHRFKKKFNPRYEPIYLLYRDEGDLPAIGIGLTRAFLPGATVRQFAAAGGELVRGGRAPVSVD